MTEQDLHIIELYLNGQLNGADKTAFEARLREDEEFRNTVVQMRATVRAVKESALDDKMRMLKEEEKSLASSDRNGFKVTALYRVVALAAILIAGIIIFRPFMQPDDTIRNQYLAENFESFVLHETTRGNNEEPMVTPEQELAYNLYAMKKFHKAMPLLEDLWEEKRDTLALFYWTVSGYAVGKQSSQDAKSILLQNSNYSESIKALAK